MAVTLKIDGDATNGFIGEVHDGATHKMYSPQTNSMYEAVLEMLHLHFGPPPVAANAGMGTIDQTVTVDQTTETATTTPAADTVPTPEPDSDPAPAPEEDQQH